MSEPRSGVRVRIAPGPTGPFHLGRSRAAVINWLFARHHGGTFVLRIEDTDKARSKPEHLQSILDSLRWLGLDWDEGPEVGGPHAPYFQMSRLATYPPCADRLLASGHAYRCFCTSDELDVLRRQAQEQRRPFRYPRTCRYLTNGERETKDKDGLPSVLRLAVPEVGVTMWNDLVLGEISIDNAEMDDFILVRSDGGPTYNFVVVVDDLTMKITHVIRGQDHVPNTPKQILIYQYLGEPMPKFAHVPLVVGLDDQKISARHGAEAVSTWGRNGGYLPDAVLNYLATTGTSYQEGRDVYSRDELVTLFDLSKVGKSRTRLDEDKIDWINSVYIRALPEDEFVRLSLPFLQLRGLVSTPPTDEDMVRATSALRLEQERVHTLAETAEAVEFFLQEAVVYDPISLVQKKATVEDTKVVLDASIEALSTLERFEHDNLEATFRSLAEKLDLKTGVVFGTIRVAITGRSMSPPLFDTMLALGEDRVLRRLNEARQNLRTIENQ